MNEIELKFTSDPEVFQKALLTDDFSERLNLLPNSADVATCEIVRYGIWNDALIIRDLQNFYSGFIVEMPEERRTMIFNYVKGMVENTDFVSTNAFLPFIVEETADHIVSTAVIDYVSLAPISENDPMSRVKDIIGMLESGFLKNDGAVFGALLFLGDERVCKLLAHIRDSLEHDDIRRVTNAVTGFIYSATTDFYLDWLEGLEGDQMDSCFGLVASGLGLIAKRAIIKDRVFTGHRPFPFKGISQAQAAAMRKEVSIEEYRRRIANRMQSLERSEPPPRVMPHVLAEWGIQSVTDSSV